MDATRRFLEGMGLPPGDCANSPTARNASPTVRNTASRFPVQKGRQRWQQSWKKRTHIISRSTASPREAASCS